MRERFADAAPYDGEYEVPIAKLYRVRVDEALARPFPDQRPGGPMSKPSDPKPEAAPEALPDTALDEVAGGIQATTGPDPRPNPNTSEANLRTPWNV